MSVVQIGRFLRPVLMFGIAGLAGCAAPGRPLIDDDPSIRRFDRKTVIFFIDGLEKPVFEALAARGELPNLTQRFIRGGVGVEHAVTCIPALTYPVTASLLTGMFPGRHGVLGNDWFERETCRFQDYNRAESYHDLDEDFTARTLFEFLPDRFTITSQWLGRRGANVRFDNPGMNAIAQTLMLNFRIDSRNVEFLNFVPGETRRAGEWPTVMAFYFPAVDQIGHALGPDSPRYADAVRHADREIGRIVHSIEQTPIAEGTAFVMVSDHGHVQLGADHGFRVMDWLKRERGLNVYRGRTTSDVQDRRRMLAPYDAVLVNSAYRRFMLHVNGPHGWITPADPQRVESIVRGPPGLLEQPAVGLLATSAGPNRVLIRTRGGSAVLEAERATMPARYRMVEIERDPLDSAATPGLPAFIQAGWHTSREWLEATAGTAYPDLVPQLSDLFTSPRVGDIVCFAAADGSFDAGEPGGHGSVCAADMIVPMYFAGAGLPKGATIPAARVVDVMPTILDLLGVADRLAKAPPIDGVSVAAALHAAKPATPAYGAP